MNDETNRFKTSFTASHALLSAALGGLMCIGATACGSNSSGGGHANTGGAGGASAGGAGGASTGGAGGASTGGSGGTATGGSGGTATGGSGGADSGTGGAPTDAGDASAADAAGDSSAADAGLFYCSNAPEAGVITSSKVVAMTVDEFQADCSSRGGVFEIMPHCGGYNSCMGMSYDTGTNTLTEHTCRGLNTCAGYSCVICS